MSADFEKVLVKDPRLDVSESIKYAVIKGGQNVTCAPYGAISQTNNQLVFNIQVPSEQTIIDRRVLLQTKLALKVVTDCAYTKAEGENAVYTYGAGCYYGVYSALAPFPLHQLMTVLSATINNNTVSINIRDVLPAIIRMLSCEDLVCWNNSTPTFRDTFASYCPVVVGRTTAHPNSSYWGVDDAATVHRGCYSPLGYTVETVEESKIPVSEGGNIKVTEYFIWELTEPLLLSPFIFTNLSNNGQGFYGIQNLNIVINIGDTKRVFRGLTGYKKNGVQDDKVSYLNPSPAIGTNTGKGKINSIYSVSGGGQNDALFSDTRLLFNFLTPHPSDLLPARNIVPFYELPRYITAQSPEATKPTEQETKTNNSFGVFTKTFTVETNSLQLNQIPDKLIIFLRKTASKQSWGDPDVAFPIESLTINFNNNSGILASAKQVDLWQFSRSNGCGLTWLDWKGLGVVPNFASNKDFCPLLESGVKSAPLAGSYLVLEFGKDIQLTEDFYAAGSLGNFNIQVKLNCQNAGPYDLNPLAGDDETGGNNLDLVLITMNSGVFVCERGTSSTYTGILTKQDVLEASQQEHYTHNDVKRLVGGGIFDMIKSGVSKLASKGKEMAMTHGKELAKKHGKKLLDKGKEMAMAKGKEMLSKYME